MGSAAPQSCSDSPLLPRLAAWLAVLLVHLLMLWWLLHAGRIALIAHDNSRISLRWLPPVKYTPSTRSSDESSSGSSEAALSWAWKIDTSRAPDSRNASLYSRRWRSGVAEADVITSTRADAPPHIRTNRWIRTRPSSWRSFPPTRNNAPGLPPGLVVTSGSRGET